MDSLGPSVKWMSESPWSSIHSEDVYYFVSAGLLCFAQQKKDRAPCRGVRHGMIPSTREEKFLICFCFACSLKGLSVFDSYAIGFKIQSIAK